jgi:TRAP-type transport system periplasmic protein
MSARAYAKLSKEQQAIFREESASAGNTMRRLIIGAEAEQLKKLGELGVQITNPDLGPFKEKMQSAYDKIGAFAGDDNVKKFLDIVAKSG